MNKKIPFLIFSLLLVSCGKAAIAFAETKTTVFFSPTDAFKNEGNGLFVNLNYKGDGDDWSDPPIPMTKTENTYHGRAIYKCEFTDKYNGLGVLQFQVRYNGEYKDHIEPINSWTKVEDYNGKLVPHGDSGNNFIDYVQDEEIQAGTELYLDTRVWDFDNVEERYAAFFYDGLGSTWVDMTQESGNVYKVVAPEGYTTVIFCRMDGSKPENTWDNRWGQTGNIYSGLITNNIYVLDDASGTGAWKKYMGIDEIFGLVDNNYTRTTTINFTSQGYDEAIAINKYKDGFSQTRTTTWIDGALYMSNGDKVNSGYFTSKEDGSMHHFKFGGESFNVASADNEVIDDGYAAADGVNEFFANYDNSASSMHYFNVNKEKVKGQFKFDTNKASTDTVYYYSNDLDIVKRFTAICAPCYKVEEGQEAFINVTTATVALNADGTIELALYCYISDNASTSKLNDGSNKFAWAVISNIGTSAIPSIMSYIE